MSNEKVEIKYHIEYRRKGQTDWRKWVILEDDDDIKKKWEDTIATGLSTFEFRLIRFSGAILKQEEGAT